MTSVRPAATPLTGFDPSGVRYGTDGLVAAIVQDERDGRVLMVAWQDAEAVAATLATGQAHFHSRSRGRLWRKGEESGHVLDVTGIALDCDSDAILLTVRPTGPTCHTGSRSCFDAGVAVGSPAPGALEPGPVEPAPSGPLSSGPDAAADLQGLAWLEQLWATIDERARTRPTGSYTVRLLEEGVDGPARKVAEEAVEVLMAAKDDAVREAAGEPRDLEPLAGEIGDLLYHVLVVCAERGLPPARVIEVLRRRHA